MASYRKRNKSADAAPVMESHGWRIYAHPLFLDQLEALTAEVESLRGRDEAGFREKKQTKLLAAIHKIALEVIPADPAARVFLQGRTMGEAYRPWRRAKFFEGRYRLFFRYATEGRVIVLTWINDQTTLRTYGSKRDAYAVFKGMLDRGNPPDDWDALMKAAKGAAVRARKTLKRG